ncbi:stAR-related lipid transfer protein 8 isoform X2 [Monodelphis domestica]|uniref:stAR-related lipid transfer protein 8 isoform X2 n=1 Tax=Monodelphis domestica TaxID=13616 RepID=UPI00044355DF|nr:stAR-related lipid transfer protein 8 isoform X2 [Monodelphis domestica]
MDQPRGRGPGTGAGAGPGPPLRLPKPSTWTLWRAKGPPRNPARWKPEIEAKKACDWLRAAGFPQYAQLYEDSLFPLDITSVKKDHGFLDQDSLRSLCRRLMTLNACASMKLEVRSQRKLNEDPEEEDLCAISNNWTFQRDSRRWSRLGSPELGVSPGAGLWAASSHESILTNISATSQASQAGNMARDTLAIVVAPPPEPSDQSVAQLESPTWAPSPGSLLGLPPDVDGPPDKPRKRRTRSFLRHLDSLRRREKPGSPEAGPSTPTKAAAPEKLGKAFSFHSRRSFLSAGFYSKNQAPDTEAEGAGAQCSGSTRESRWQHQQGHWQACLVHVPGDHKPGTFPRSLSIESLCPKEGHRLVDWQKAGSWGPEKRRGSCSSMDSRLSVYDNMPELMGNGERPRDLDPEANCSQLDDILQDMWGLQKHVELWSQAVCPDGGQPRQEEEEEEEDTDSAGEQAFPFGMQLEEEHSMSDMGTSASDFDSTGNSLNETEETEIRERRDSGVGASLTRPCRKLRWHSFQNSHRPSLNSASLELNRQSVAQLNLLHKGSLLRLTALMEKYSVPHKQTWAWAVPKFMKRSKTPSYQGKSVFGVPLLIHMQRTGQPLPQSIQQAMRYLRSQCLDQVGIFRKSGVKSRIQTLRQMNEASPEHVVYEGQSAYDVADLLKQYFRDLPEPIFTSKLTTTFLRLYQFVPKDQQLSAAQAAVVLLPDENREVLQTLLYFLSDIAAAQENQMTAGNLAVCLAPSIFHLNVSKDSTSPRVIPRRGQLGKPAPRDLSENMAATQGLSHMITDCKKLFQVPQDMMLQLCNSYVVSKPSSPPLALAELRGKPGDYLEESAQSLLQEAAERFKGWLNVPGPQHTELASKKVRDGHPLRLWKVTTEVAAPPMAVLHRVLRERAMWDEDLLRAHVLESLGPGVDVYHYVTDSMAPQPSRDFVVLRMWRSDLPRGGCLLVSQSLEPEEPVPESGVRAVLLTSQYLIEPYGPGHSRLIHICRADLRGHSPDWYNKVFGHLCAMEVARIRDSFATMRPIPETKL